MFKRLALLLALFATSVAPAAFAQSGFANMIDHLHLGVTDQAKAVEWYHKNFSGELMSEGPERVLFGTTRIIFQLNKSPKPSEGSVLDLIGFSVADVDATVKRLQAEGRITAVMSRDDATQEKILNAAIA